MESQYINAGAVEQISLPAQERQKDEVDLTELLYLLWEHLLQIAVCFVLGGAAAFAVTYFLMEPQYQASAKLYVVSASSNSIVNLSDLQLGSQLTADYQELILSRPVLEDVIKTLGLDIPLDEQDELADRIEIENPPNTRILSITVTYPDQQKAAEIANEIAQQAVFYLPEIMESPTPNLYESAVVPSQKASPSYTIHTLIGALLAALACCLWLMVGYLVNDTFTSSEEISQYFGVQPLAVIPEGNFKDHAGKHGLNKIVSNA